MPEHHQSLYLETLTIVLCAAAVTTVLFQRLKQPVVLGYLLAGMIIGPNIPIPLLANSDVVESLAELGVILLMFSLGIEFSLKELLRVGPAAGLIAVMETSLMVSLGYLVARAFGWTRLESFYTGAIVAISSTTVIVKAFVEQKVRGPFTKLVLGVLIFEDLVAIMLITVLTTLSAGEDVGIKQLGISAGQLVLFLGGLVIVGIAIVPRAMRMVVKLGRPETIVVASVGVAFGFALVAMKFRYSVALGAFLGGSVVAMSGVEKRIERLVEPVRDIFAAIFFVSVGMLIDPAAIFAHWGATLAIIATVVLGKLVCVSVAAFLSGQRLDTAVKTGMSLAQIGEFSFIIAGVGVASGATSRFLYPLAVGVSAVTTLLTPWLIRAADPVAALIDRKLPRPLQTFVCLYGSWVEQMQSSAEPRPEPTRLRRLLRWLAADTLLIAAITIGVTTEFAQLVPLVEDWLGASSAMAGSMILAVAGSASLPFWVGMIRTARSLGLELSERALPPPTPGKLDLADASRRLFVVTLQLAITVIVGAPLIAITLPLLSTHGATASLAVMGGFVLLLVVVLWRRATNLQGHVTAASAVIAEALSRQTRDEPEPSTSSTGVFPVSGVNTPLAPVDSALRGLGKPTMVVIAPGSPAAGKTLAEINLRGLTGATVLAIRRGEELVPIPDGRAQLVSGDVLVIAGSRDATDAAKAALAAP